MINSQDSKQTNQSKSKDAFRLFGILAIGAILVISIAISKSRFLEQYWRLREVIQNQDKWDNRQITHYKMLIDLPYDTTYFRQLPMPLTIEVKDGSIVSMVDGQGKMIPVNTSGDAAQNHQNFFTISGLFLYARQSIMRNPPSIEISYDDFFGFPSRIYIDPYTEPCCQDFEIKIEDFQVLP